MEHAIILLVKFRIRRLSLALNACQVYGVFFFFVWNTKLPRALRNAVAEHIAVDDRLLDRRAASSRCKAPWALDCVYLQSFLNQSSTIHGRHKRARPGVVLAFKIPCNLVR